MKKVIKPLSIAALFCIFTFGSVNEAKAWKFWGKETTITAYVGGYAIETTATYRFGIKVKEESVTIVFQ